MVAAKGIRAGRAFVELLADDRALRRVLTRAGRRLQRFGAGVRRIGLAVTAAGAAMVAPFAAAVRVFQRTGDEIAKMARRVGVGVEALQSLGLAAELGGATLADLEKGIRRLQKNINDAERGLTTSVDALQELGLTFRDLRDLAPEEQFLTVAESLSRVENFSKRSALAQDLLGRAGTRLLPVIERGRAGFAEIREEAERLGIIMSAEDAAAAEELTDAFSILRRVMVRTAQVIGAALAPAVQASVEFLTRAIATVNQFIDENRRLVRIAAAVALGVLAVGAALITLGTAISLAGFALIGIGAALAAVIAIFKALAAAVAFMLSPIGAVILAIGVMVSNFTSAGNSISRVIEFLGDKFRELGEFVGGVFRGIAKAISSGNLELAANILFLSLRVAFVRGVGFLREQWIEFRAFFLRTAAEIFFGASKIAIDAFAGLRRILAEIGAFVRRTFADIVSRFQEPLNLAELQLQLARNRARAREDPTFDLARANREAEEAFIAKQLSAQDTLARKQEQAEQSRREALAEIASEQEAATKKIAAALDAALANTGQKRAEALARLQAELAKARDALAAALQEADDLPSEGGLLGRLRETFREMEQSLQASVETVSAIQGGAAARLAFAGPSADVARRTADATEETAINTKRIADVAERGEGLRFQ